MSIFDEISRLVKERDEYKRLCGHILATIRVNFYRDTLRVKAGYRGEWEKMLAGWEEQIARVKKGTE